MPVVSKAENAAMHAAAKGHSTLGIPQSVGQEFTADQPPGSVKQLPEHVGKTLLHGRAIAGAKALHAAGHISEQQRDQHIAKSQAMMKPPPKGRAPAKAETPRKPFGSFAP